MDLLRLHCFSKERDYLLELATWSQKMGFACLAIIERPVERRRLTDQIGNLMVPDMCVTSQLRTYVSSRFVEDHRDVLTWLANKGKTEADENQPHPSPARHPLTIESEPIIDESENEGTQSDNPQPEGNPPAESRTQEIITDGETEGNDANEVQLEEVQGVDENRNGQPVVTPLSLVTLLQRHKRGLRAVKKHRNSLCRRAIVIDSLQSTIPTPFVPLYNKAESDLRDLRKRLRKMVKKLAVRLLRYLRFLERENELRLQIYQNLLHVTPLQVLLLGHLPREQQMTLLEVIAAVRKFSVPLLLSRFEEIQRVRRIDTGSEPHLYAQIEI